MNDKILYCFRNRVSQSENEIRKRLEQKGIDCLITPTYCMKLCMFCENLNVAIVNQEIVMEKNNDLIVSKIVEKLDY